MAKIEMCCDNRFIEDKMGLLYCNLASRCIDKDLLNPPVDNRERIACMFETKNLRFFSNESPSVDPQPKGQLLQFKICLSETHHTRFL